MKYLGVIGHPLKQSLSPVIQQAALDHLRLDILYEAWATPDDGLATRFTGLRSPSVLGANVTIPHKEAALVAMDELDDVAQKVGAVNTIVNCDGRLRGYNTDPTGFLRALREDAGFDPSGCRVLVAGAGGAARAVVVALTEANAVSVTVINRTLPRATKLIDDLRSTSTGTVLTPLPDEPSSWADALDGCDLLVNCTSVGSAGSPEEKDSPVPVELLRPDILVYDLIYRPTETPLMSAARQLGCKVVGGLPMLIYQGAASFVLWTGREAPLAIMFDAARQALGPAPVSGEH